jgi:hypothetical protein
MRVTNRLAGVIRVERAPAVSLTLLAEPERRPWA